MTWTLFIEVQALILTLHAQKCAWTMLLSRFNNTCWIDNVDEYCSINSCSMLTKNNNCYNVVGTRADNTWWNISLLMVVRTMLFSAVKSSCPNNVDELTCCCKLLKQLSTTLVNDKRNRVVRSLSGKNWQDRDKVFFFPWLLRRIDMFLGV